MQLSLAGLPVGRCPTTTRVGYVVATSGPPEKPRPPAPDAAGQRAEASQARSEARP